MSDVNHPAHIRVLPHSSHWGAFSVRVRGRGVEIVPHPRDAAPSALLGNIPASVSHRARIARPMVRRGWLERGPRPDPRRGCGGFGAGSLPPGRPCAAAGISRGDARHGAGAHRRGAEFHLIGPLRDDLPGAVEAVWHPILPGTDVALMLGLAHTLVGGGLHDRAFLERFCVGWAAFEAYLLGSSDGQPKDAAWAAAICGIPADEILALV